MSEKKHNEIYSKEVTNLISKNQKVDCEVVEKFLKTKGFFETEVIDKRKLKIVNEK